MSEWITNFLQDERPLFDDGFDDIYDDTMHTPDDGMVEDLDGSIMDTLLFVGLAAALAFLVYYRQQRQQAHRQDEEQARHGQRDGQNQNQAQAPPPVGGEREGGVFPPPGNPDVANWMAGGIGH